MTVATQTLEGQRSVTLYREIDALGGAAMSSSAYDRAYHDGHSQALEAVLTILARRGFSEEADVAPRWDDPLTPAEVAMIDAAWEEHKAADPVCRIPPQGWACTRGAGHSGPCAAIAKATSL